MKNRITIQKQNLYVLPHESFLNFHGIIRKDSPNGPPTNNATTFFLILVWQINGCEIDRTR